MLTCEICDYEGYTVHCEWLYVDGQWVIVHLCLTCYDELMEISHG